MLKYLRPIILGLLAFAALTACAAIVLLIFGLTAELLKTSIEVGMIAGILLLAGRLLRSRR